MPKIHILPPEEALKIAAGEVIERPAHVVKELIENSIDAKSTIITLFVEQAGKKLIRVVDNGCGMEPDDALACFLPHATSKITRLGDLETIQSFGFRGEALASVAAISVVTLTTKSQDMADQDLGVCIEYSENKLLKQRPIACKQGTDIAVHDLFFNTPVRRKFLKQDETEWNAIQSIFHAFCLSNPAIAFKLYHDNKLMLNAPAVEQLIDRATQVWDFQVSQHLIPLIDSEAPVGFRIHGLISHPHFWRYGRNYIHFFVNQRWVRNNELGKALFKGYLNVLPPERFPAGLVFVAIDPLLIDVNVHPKKEEIRFAKSVSLPAQLTLLVKKTLESNLSSHLSSGVRLPSPDGSTSSRISTTTNQVATQSLMSYQQPMRPIPDLDTIFEAASKPVALHEPTQLFQPQIVTTQPGEPKLVGQVFNTYLIFESEQEIIFIDQHAAHERILYEKFKQQSLQQQGTVLIFPELVQLTPLQYQALATIQDSLANQGITYDLLAAHEIVIRSCPPQLKGSFLKEFIIEIAQFVEDHENLNPADFGKRLHEHMYAQLACKSAVKAGDVLTIEQMRQLLRDLNKTENRFICVHGRPTIWSVPKTQLEKQFKRT